MHVMHPRVHLRKSDWGLAEAGRLEFYKTEAKLALTNAKTQWAKEEVEHIKQAKITWEKEELKKAKHQTEEREKAERRELDELKESIQVTSDFEYCIAATIVGSKINRSSYGMVPLVGSLTLNGNMMTFENGKAKYGSGSTYNPPSPLDLSKMLIEVKQKRNDRNGDMCIRITECENKECTPKWMCDANCFNENCVTPKHSIRGCESNIVIHEFTQKISFLKRDKSEVQWVVALRKLRPLCPDHGFKMIGTIDALKNRDGTFSLTCVGHNVRQSPDGTVEWDRIRRRRLSRMERLDKAEQEFSGAP